jgi:pilus assembly protein TadC
VNGVLLLALGAGGLFGGSVFWLGWQLRPATPALGPALARLDPDQAAAAAGRPGGQLWGWAAQRIAPAADLAVLDYTGSRYLLEVLACAAAGLTLGPVLAVAGTVLGLGVSLAVPAGIGAVLAVIAMAGYVRGIHAQAARARAAYRRGVCVYLDQVALCIAAGHGPVASLERAATSGDGPVFTRLRDTIAEAQLRMEPPWDRLRDLAEVISVPALGDLADIMHASGTAGAQVYTSLRAKAAGLRTQIRTDELTTAKSSSTALDALGAVLVLVLLILAAYPFVARIPIP